MATTKTGSPQKLDALYETIQSLSPSSSVEEFEKFGAFFHENCKAWIKNMNEYATPGIGRQGTIDKLRSIMTEKLWSIAERKVLASSVTEDGSRVFCETEKRLIVHGEPIDPFFETEVAVFNAEGLITELRLYSCWSPIASVIQQKTGNGPYAHANYKAKARD
jgi:limonene-1,2-epoxide hydrolase